MTVLYSDLIPEECRLIRRFWNKNYGVYTRQAPAEATLIRISLVSVGGQGGNYGGCGAFARRLAPCAPNEVFELQVGQPGTAGPPGDSWVRRQIGGEMLCYADRGRGVGTPGDAAKSIGDVVRSGQAGRSGSDAGDVARLGFGGVIGINRNRAPGPGGGGYNEIWPNDILYAAGQGAIAIAFYAGHPGAGY